MQSIQIMGDRLEIPSHLHNGNWDTEPHFDSADWDDTRVVIDGIIRQSKTDFAEFSLLTDQWFKREPLAADADQSFGWKQ